MKMDELFGIKLLAQLSLVGVYSQESWFTWWASIVPFGAATVSQNFHSFMVLRIKYRSSSELSACPVCFRENELLVEEL